VALSIKPLSADVCVYKPPKVRRICGIIVDPQGVPVPRVTVTILKGTRKVETTTTEDNGEFDFDVMESGKYELDATASGFNHAQYQMTLASPSRSCEHALRVEMEIGSIHCKGDTIRETKNPLSQKR